jgi:hypothetical protein
MAVEQQTAAAAGALQASDGVDPLARDGGEFGIQAQGTHAMHHVSGQQALALGLAVAFLADHGAQCVQAGLGVDLGQNVLRSHARSVLWGN